MRFGTTQVWNLKSYTANHKSNMWDWVRPSMENLEMYREDFVRFSFRRNVSSILRFGKRFYGLGDIDISSHFRGVRVDRKWIRNVHQVKALWFNF